jgi:hypothetical protein
MLELVILGFGLPADDLRGRLENLVRASAQR